MGNSSICIQASLDIRCAIFETSEQLPCIRTSSKVVLVSPHARRESSQMSKCSFSGGTRSTVLIVGDCDVGRPRNRFFFVKDCTKRERFVVSVEGEISALGHYSVDRRHKQAKVPLRAATNTALRPIPTTPNVLHFLVQHFVIISLWLNTRATFADLYFFAYFTLLFAIVHFNTPWWI